MSKDRIRIFFASDIHGSEICFKKFLNAAEFYKCDVIILGGDITGKFIVPVYDLGDHYICKIGGREEILTNREQLENNLQRIRDSGSYPYLTTRENWEDIIKDTSKMEQVFDELVKESIRKWINYAEIKLEGKKVKCFVMPGNDDSYSIDPILNQSTVIINPNEKVVEISDKIQMLSLGYSNITPWRCPRDVSEEEIEEKITKLMGSIDRGSQLIYCIHVPPYDSGIDSAPELDENMKPKVGPGGQLMVMPVGSKAVRRSIEVYQPLLSLHGHIHEARGFTKIGKTMCFNPGSEYHEGILRGVLIQIENNKVKDFIFTSG
ncbi:MAG: metallophosphoesterase [Thaumarchaeota archaeon]|jgi:Icc-related predicted phosphoesterase|nr:metallophosphoesterase [Candidatus Geocrenenecus arthurdayi]MCL7390602.1 metallophosphoesterase [Candidatus Geocrenenecus arthurdayi]MCL7403226.1 metallophosphoesterase [Candidatus Geocrenenecus arthurdayi]